MAYIILFIFSIIINISNSLSDENEPIRITIYPSRISESGIGSNKIIISKKDIKESNAKNIPDLIAKQTGIQTISLYGGVDNTKASIGIGGFGEQASMNTAIFLDGVRLNNISMAAVNFGNIPLENIEKIEIIKGGGASVLFGDGAVSGAINIITNKKIFKKNTYTINQEFKSYNGRKTKIYGYQNFEDFSIQFNNNYTRSDQYRDNNDYKLDSTSINVSSMNDEGVFTFMKLKKYDEDIRLPGGISKTDYFLNPKQTKESFAFTRDELSSLEVGYNGLYVGEFQTSGSISLSEKDSISYFDYSRYYSGSHSSDASNQYDYDTIQGYKNGQYKSTLFNLPISYKMGIDFYNSYYSDKVILGSYYKRTADQITIDPWFISQISFRNDFDFEAGIRHHFYKLDVYDETTNKQKLYNKSKKSNAWSLGGIKKINESNALNFKLSKSFRSPKVDEVLHYGGVISDVNHQNSNMLEIGHKFSLRQIRVKTNFYKSKIDNIIYYDSSAFVNKNYGETTHKGLDIETTIKHNKTLYNLNISNVTSQFDTGLNKGKQLPMVANWKSNASVKYKYNKQLKFLLSNDFVGSRYRIGDESNSSQKSKSYNLFNIGMNYKLNDLDISLKLNNLFDKKHYHYETSGGVYPLSERNMSFGLKYLF